MNQCTEIEIQEMLPDDSEYLLFRHCSSFPLLATLDHMQPDQGGAQCAPLSSTAPWGGSTTFSRCSEIRQTHCASRGILLSRDREDERLRALCTNSPASRSPARSSPPVETAIDP